MKNLFKIIKLTLFLFLVLNDLFGQITFKAFYLDGNNGRVSSLKNIGNKYFLIDSYEKINITSLDSAGNLLNKRSISYNSGANDININSWHAVYGSGTNLIMAAVFQDFSDNNSRLINIDTSSAIQWSYIYSDSSPFWRQRFLSATHSNYIICSRNDIGYPYFLNIDSIGILRNRWQFYNLQGNVNSVIVSSDSSFIVGFNLDTLGVSVARYDDDGNCYWSKTFMRSPAMLNEMIENSDGSITLIGSLDTIPYLFQGYYYTQLFMCKIDTSGNIIWAKAYGNALTPFNGFVSTIKTKDDGYLITSNYYKSNSLKADILMIKTDENGDTLWIRSHGNLGTDEVNVTAIETVDSGYVFLGISDAYPGMFPGYNGSYVVKTDSLGHTASLCQEENNSLFYIPFFPNDSLINISLLIDTVTQTNSLLFTAVDTPPNVVDGCTLTFISENFNLSGKQIKTYPNPTKGKITITTPDKPSLQDYITVYDSVGKIVLQRPYKQEKQEMDLSHLSKGLYTIKVVQEGKVSVSKVVVE